MVKAVVFVINMQAFQGVCARGEGRKLQNSTQINCPNFCLLLKVSTYKSTHDTIKIMQIIKQFETPQVVEVRFTLNIVFKQVSSVPTYNSHGYKAALQFYLAIKSKQDT